jgi:predicted DNA-binding transcriptional regulator AlpA
MNERGTVEILGKRYFTRASLASELGLAKATLACWRVKGKGPPQVMIGRRILYDVEKVQEWIAESASSRQGLPSTRRDESKKENT